MPARGGEESARRYMEQTIAMLKAVVDGHTYELTAGDFGVSRTAVERRVKTLAARICRQVGVEGLSEGATAFVYRLRRHRDAILIALDKFDPTLREAHRTGRLVSTEDIARAVLRIRGRSAEPSRDIALFVTLLATGARPLEIARLEVRDYLNADGSVRRASELRADAAITGRSRPLRFESDRLDESMFVYLRERVDLRQGLGLLCEYRGLDPRSPLFLTSTGEGFKITPYGAPGQYRFLCRPILETYRKLFRYAELPGVTSLAVRRAVVSGLYRCVLDERSFPDDADP